MIKYFCDKCGKELDSFNNTMSSDRFTVTINPPEIRKWADDAETGTYILCYYCVRKFNKWIYGKIEDPRTDNISDSRR